MITNTKNRIISYIKDNKKVRVHDVAKFLGISNVAVHKQLKNLLDTKVLRKIGKSPFVFYALRGINVDNGEIAKVCKDNDISQLSVFGSVARGEEREDSDIDLMARFSKPKSLLDLVRTESEFEKVFGTKVDLLTEASVSPYIKDVVQEEMKVIYAQ